MIIPENEFSTRSSVVAFDNVAIKCAGVLNEPKVDRRWKLELGIWPVILLILVGLSQGDAFGAESVAIEAGFESGRFQHRDGMTDAFWIRTLSEDQVGKEVISTGSGGGGPTSGWDLRVVKSESVGGQSVKPRTGQYFARFLIDRTKNYQNLNDGIARPRAELHALAEQTYFDFDTEVWLGVSIFVPKNFQDEMKNNHLGGIVLISTNTDSSASFMSVRIQVPEGKTESHWVVKTHTDDSSVTDSTESKTFTDLGPVSPDKGKWTDFVIRMRSNPFSVDTNPAKLGIRNANDKLYRGNKGILQVWKSEGSVDNNGDRRMALSMNILNAPIGLVPGTTDGKSMFHSSLRTYKAHWQLQDTSVFSPIWIGFDEFRLGQAIADSTRYSDVHPSGKQCTDQCPGSTSAQSEQVPARPKPPRNLTITR